MQGVVGVGEFEDAAEGGEAEFGTSAFPVQAVQDERHGLPLVGVAAAVAAGGDAAEAVRGEVGGVAVAGRLGCVRGEQHLAVFGDEEEQQAVNGPEQRAVQGLRGDGLVVGVLERLPKSLVVGVLDEAGAEGLDGFLDGDAELVEDARRSRWLPGATSPASRRPGRCPRPGARTGTSARPGTAARTRRTPRPRRWLRGRTRRRRRPARALESRRTRSSRPLVTTPQRAAALRFRYSCTSDCGAASAAPGMPLVRRSRSTPQPS